jgi:hypothetical protein
MPLEGTGQLGVGGVFLAASGALFEVPIERATQVFVDYAAAAFEYVNPCFAAVHDPFYLA